MMTTMPCVAVPQSLTLVQPKAGAIFYGGQTRLLSWTGVDADAVVTVFVEDTLHAPFGYPGAPIPYQIVTRLDSTVTSYRWQVPYSFRTSQGYQIRIVAEYPNDPTKQPVTVTQMGTFTVVQVGDANVTVHPGAPLPTPTN